MNKNSFAIIKCAFVLSLFVLLCGDRNAVATPLKYHPVLMHLYRGSILTQPDAMCPPVPYTKPPDNGTADLPPVEQRSTFVDWFANGVQAYLANDHETCIAELERANQEYRNYYETLSACRIRCERKRKREFKSVYEQYNVNDMQFYESMLYKTKCTELCRADDLKSYSRYFGIDAWTQQQFRERKPYEYLQLCYYKEDNVEKAISATYTAMLTNPNSKLMRGNMDYYKKLPIFQDGLHLIDLEAKRFRTLFVYGIEAYSSENWTVAIEYIERAIDQYLFDEDECRAYCDGDFEQGWTFDFAASLSNHFVFAMRCKQNCTLEMDIGSTNTVAFPLFYDYLQFAYFSVNKIVEACRAAKTYLEIQQNDSVMLDNYAFYQRRMNETKIDDGECNLRQEAVEYLQRLKYERLLLARVDEDFKFLDSIEGEHETVATFFDK